MGGARGGWAEAPLPHLLPQPHWKAEPRHRMAFPALRNIPLDSIKKVAESARNGHPPLSVQASGVWGAQKVNGAVWADAIRAPVRYVCAVAGIPSWPPQKTGPQRSPGVALSNGCSESYMCREETGSFHQSEGGRIKDGNTGTDGGVCQKGCWKIKQHSSRTGTIRQSLRDAAKAMWDSGHRLLFIAHILVG